MRPAQIAASPLGYLRQLMIMRAGPSGGILTVEQHAFWALADRRYRGTNSIAVRPSATGLEPRSSSPHSAANAASSSTVRSRPAKHISMNRSIAVPTPCPFTGSMTTTLPSGAAARRHPARILRA